MIPAGSRPHLVTFERLTVTVDDYGQEIPGAAATIAEAFARVKYGTGQERREAAQEKASQAITIECNFATALATVVVTDRAKFDDRAWDIVSIAPLGLNREIHFGAVAVG